MAIPEVIFHGPTGEDPPVIEVRVPAGTDGLWLLADEASALSNVLRANSIRARQAKPPPTERSRYPE